MSARPVSESVQDLADRLAPYRETGLSMAPIAVEAVWLTLEALARDARGLEELAAKACTGYTLSPEVVRIASLLARNGVTAGLSERGQP